MNHTQMTVNEMVLSSQNSQCKNWAEYYESQVLKYITFCSYKYLTQKMSQIKTADKADFYYHIQLDKDS